MGPDRRNFLMSPAEVNAWYQPERNSITFPYAILNPPYYRYSLIMLIQLSIMTMWIADTTFPKPTTMPVREERQVTNSLMASTTKVCNLDPMGN